MKRALQFDTAPSAAGRSVTVGPGDTAAATTVSRTSEADCPEVSSSASDRSSVPLTQSSAFGIDACLRLYVS